MLAVHGEREDRECHRFVAAQMPLAKVQKTESALSSGPETNRPAPTNLSKICRAADAH
jgi:hypothetical protein